MTRSRYQAGSLEKLKSSSGPCWYIRFRDDHPRATVKRPRYRIGLVSDFPTRALANRAAEHIRKTFNEAGPQVPPRKFHELIDRYEAEEMPTRYSTAKGYRNLLRNHIDPKWGDVPIDEVRAEAVRKWLKSLALAPKTCGHIRDMMRTLFRFAMLWEWIPAGPNPMSLFVLEGASRRTRKPRILRIHEFHSLVRQIPEEPFKTMVLIAGCLGLSCSELLGLQWHDINFADGTLRIVRAIVDGRVGDVKVEARGKPLPMHDKVADLFRAQLKRTQFRRPDDFVFASPYMAGEKPFYASHIQVERIAPAAEAAGLGKHIGWHTFRHSYRAWLDSGGTPVGVQRDLMRHSDIKTTMNVYGGSFVEGLRDANDQIVSQVLQ